MKIGVAGAGAVGCHYGSLLQRAGYEVVLLARGVHLQTLQRQGLEHESGGQRWIVPVHATDDASELSGCDVLLLCSKMTGLNDLLSKLNGCVGKDTLLVTLQNGVEAPDIVAEHFPGHAVVAGTAFIGARIEAPGHVIHSAAGGMRLAAWGQGSSEDAVDGLLEALDKAGVPSRREADAQLMLWRKLLWNVGFNALTAITRRYASDMAAAAETLEIVRAAMQEAVDLAQSRNIALDEEDIAKHISITLEMGPVKTSMWQDIEAGRPTEVDYINGFVARESREKSMPAPVNSMLTAMLHAIEHRT